MTAGSTRESGRTVVPIPCSAKRERATASCHPDLFNVELDVLLYDLTSTYFESNPPFAEDDKRRFGYPRDKRSDCVQVVIALVVTPEGLPLAYEVLPGNTSDSKTLHGFLDRIEQQYGKARRVWIMDRGVPTEETLQRMRTADPPVHYLVGTPKGRLSTLENNLLLKPWHEARPSVRVKLLAQDDEMYVFAQSADRISKERSMRKRQLKKLWLRLQQLSSMLMTRKELLMKLGAARSQYPAGWRLVQVDVDDQSAAFTYCLLRDKLKGDLSIRPIHHQLEHRIEAHIFIAFLAYCLHATLTQQLRPHAPGLTPRSVFDKFAGVQMLDVEIPTTDERQLTLTRYTEPEPELRLLLEKLRIELPAQPPPRITAAQAQFAPPV